MNTLCGARPPPHSSYSKKQGGWHVNFVLNALTTTNKCNDEEHTHGAAVLDELQLRKNSGTTGHYSVDLDKRMKMDLPC